MISYAVSSSAVGSLNKKTQNAFRDSKFRNIEYCFNPYPDQMEKTRESDGLLRTLTGENAIFMSSMHLPFGLEYWDPAALDESRRKESVEHYLRLLRDHADMLAPMATFHASLEPPLSEHPRRLDQACRTIEDLLPTAREYGFRLNVESLPRTCLGNTPEELWKIVSRFDPEDVGICFDVNHLMSRYRDLPEIVTQLSSRIHAFHISDYDGVDEMHWFPGQGIIDWPEVMKRIRMIEHNVLLIMEPDFQLNGDNANHEVDPAFALRQSENAAFFLENCEMLVPQMKTFRIPGNA